LEKVISKTEELYKKENAMIAEIKAGKSKLVWRINFIFEFTS